MQLPSILLQLGHTYLVSGPLVNLDPANMSFQWPWTQLGILGVVHVQCFCVDANPIPIFDQSVVRDAEREGSKVRTPSLTKRIISSLDFLKISSMVESQRNLCDLLDRNSRKGAIIRLRANAYATWLTIPNHDRMSVMFVGVGKSLIAARVLPVGLKPVDVTSNPANSTVLIAN